MKQQRVYVDTSVIGGCFDKEYSVWSEGLMHDFAARTFRPVTSVVVQAEIDVAPAFIQQKYAELLDLGPEILPITDAAVDLAGSYQALGILTPKFYNDGLHIAIATVAQVDVLVSWNFRHIVHFSKIRLFNGVNIQQGYGTIQIYSPREVTTYDENREKSP
jgi:predicted nucleic acid-binding protein